MSKEAEAGEGGWGEGARKNPRETTVLQGATGNH